MCVRVCWRLDWVINVHEQAIRMYCTCTDGRYEYCVRACHLSITIYLCRTAGQQDSRIAG